MGGGGWGADPGMDSGAAMSSGAASIHIPHQLLHLLQGARQHENVVAGQQQGGYLGQLADGGALGVGHDLSQAVHSLVQIMHPFPLPAVDLKSQVLRLFLDVVGPAIGLAAPRTVLSPGLASLPVGPLLSAVGLEHLVVEEPSNSIIHHQVWGRGAAAGGASVRIHLG